MIRVKELKNKLLLTFLYGLILIVFWALDIPCLFKLFLKIQCPGCGMSGAFFECLKFNFVQAFHFHPMFWSMPILYLYFLLDFNSLKKKKLHIAVLIGIGIGFLINWILKFN
mgnify:FL=1